MTKKFKKGQDVTVKLFDDSSCPYYSPGVVTKVGRDKMSVVVKNQRLGLDGYGEKEVEVRIQNVSHERLGS
jgi:hypothetical protein